MKDKLAQVRKRASYYEWQQAIRFLGGNPSRAEILKFIHSTLNGHSAYGSITKADYSQESLELAMSDSTKVTCRSCGWTGTQQDCNFGHDDFYCPNCGRENLDTLEFGCQSKLEMALLDKAKCGLKDGELPGEGEACENCRLNREVHEYEEHPTFCELLQEVEEKYASYPVPLHSMSPV